MASQCCYGNSPRLVEVKGLNASFTSREDWCFPGLFLCAGKYWDGKDYEVDGPVDFILVSKEGNMVVYPDGAEKKRGTMATDRTRGYTYEVVTGNIQSLITVEEYASQVLNG